MNTEDLTAHLLVDRYGDFLLSEGIRPALHVPVVPREGYRLGLFTDAKSKVCMPVVAAAVSRERLFDVFLAMVEQLSETVDVILETSHLSWGPGHRDLNRSDIDRSVLLSHFYDFEDLLIDDGCTGVAVISEEGTCEVQFDEHKILVVYGFDLKPFEEILRRAGVPRDDTIRFISEGEHLHSTDKTFREQFEELCSRLGIHDPVESLQW